MYYFNDNERYSYQMRPLIYDAKFKVAEEITQTMGRISFPNLLPTFFVKEFLFSLSSVTGKPLQLDIAAFNKIRLSCAELKYKSIYWKNSLLW